MEYKYIVCEAELCSGCQLCEFACSVGKAGAFDLELSRVRTSRPDPTVMVSIACRLCEGVPCVKACPRDALSTSEENGTIVVDEAKCTGCGWCIEACDFGAIALDPHSKCVVICDLCPDLDTPRCVEYCPKGALSLASPSMVAERKRRKVTQSE